MIERLAGKAAILERLILEVRYDYGYGYLDRTGKFINSIFRKCPEWTVNNPPTAQASSLISLSNGAIFSYTPLNYFLSLDRDIGKESLGKNDFDEFRDQIGILSKNINMEFGLENFTRVGFRILYAFSCNNMEEAVKWVDDLGLQKINSNLLEAFQGKTDRMGGDVVIKVSDRNIRLQFGTFQREIKVDLGQTTLSVVPHRLPKHQHEALLDIYKARNRIAKNPEFACTIDVDVFRENPIEMDAEHFIDSSDKLITDSLSLYAKKGKLK